MSIDCWQCTRTGLCKEVSSRSRPSVGAQQECHSLLGPEALLGQHLESGCGCWASLAAHARMCSWWPGGYTNPRCLRRWTGWGSLGKARGCALEAQHLWEIKKAAVRKWRLEEWYLRLVESPGGDGAEVLCGNSAGAAVPGVTTTRLSGHGEGGELGSELRKV